MAEELVAGHGRIVAEFFDTDRSRRLPWPDRPDAGGAAAVLADPDRGFDAVVAGEYERAFYGEQVLTLLPAFEEHGVQLWLPEAHGPVNFRDATHRALLMLLGAQSRREVLRARARALSAMRAQTRTRVASSAAGRCTVTGSWTPAHTPTRCTPSGAADCSATTPIRRTAPTVRWIFAERLAGRSASAIAGKPERERRPEPIAGRPAT